MGYEQMPWISTGYEQVNILSQDKCLKKLSTLLNCITAMRPENACISTSQLCADFRILKIVLMQVQGNMLAILIVIHF